MGATDDCFFEGEEKEEDWRKDAYFEVENFFSTEMTDDADDEQFMAALIRSQIESGNFDMVRKDVEDGKPADAPKAKPGRKPRVRPVAVKHHHDKQKKASKRGHDDKTALHQKNTATDHRNHLKDVKACIERAEASRERLSRNQNFLVKALAM